LTEELLLGITILSAGGTTTVPLQVRKVLKLDPAQNKREKVLWTLQGVEAMVTKGTQVKLQENNAQDRREDGRS
jgi:hypothetical protein